MFCKRLGLINVREAKIEARVKPRDNASNNAALVDYKDVA